MKKDKFNTDRKTEFWHDIARKELKCPICPPNKGENAKRKAKHGVKKRKYKNKR